MPRTANENAACLRRICKRSDQPKIERLVNNAARLILRGKLNWTTTRVQTESHIATVDSCFDLVGLAMIFLRDSLCLSGSFLIAATTRYSGFFLLSFVTRFACDVGQRFGFEFHLRSSPSAYSGFVNISRPAEYFTACYTVLKRPNKVETAVHGCNVAFSLDSIVSLPR